MEFFSGPSRNRTYADGFGDRRSTIKLWSRILMSQRFWDHTSARSYGAVFSIDLLELGQVSRILPLGKALPEGAGTRIL